MTYSDLPSQTILSLLRFYRNTTGNMEKQKILERILTERGLGIY